MNTLNQILLPLIALVMLFWNVQLLHSEEILVKQLKESIEQTGGFERLYLECNTKIKNDITHKDCVYKTK